LLFFSSPPHPPRSTLFPYTTLFRSLNFLCGLIEPGAQSTWPRSTSSFFVPRSSAPRLSPAWPESRSLRNISMPVTIVFCVGRRRSEEHTSELQSRSDLVCRLLLEKK